MRSIMAHLTINFRSKALGMPVMLDVLMPQGKGGYKTLYLLHGAGGDYASWVLNTRIADYVNNRNIAVVMPSGKNRFYINNEYGRKFYTYITEELVSQCEKWFDISRNAEDRYIAGMSMGGYGAVYAALKKPSMYNTAFAYSGLLNILERYDKPQGIDMFPVFGTRQQLIDNGYDLYTLVDEYADNEEKMHTKYIIACGTEDPRIHMSRQFGEALTRAGIDNVYRESPGEHNFAYWDYCIEQTVKYICGEDSLWQ
jgi:putative tributyrin esterase